MTTQKSLARRLSAGIIAATLITTAAFAQTSIVDSAIAKLRADGFTQFQVGRTFFGRIKIDAISPTAAREIIMNRATGEVLHEVDMTAKMDAMRAEFANNGATMGTMDATSTMGGTGTMGSASSSGGMGSSGGTGSSGGSGGMGGTSGSGGMGG